MPASAVARPGCACAVFASRVAAWRF